MNRVAVFCVLIWLINFDVANSSSQEVLYRLESAVLQTVETVDVPATAAGPIVEMNVGPGDLVDAAQLIAKIDSRDALIKLKEAELERMIIEARSESKLEIEYAQKSRQVLVADLRRAQDSNRRYSGVVSDREMDRLRLMVEQSDAEIKKLQFEHTLIEIQKQQREAAVEKSQMDVDRHSIKSPVSGQIIETLKSPGEWVDISETVVKAVRLDRLKIQEYFPVDVANSNIKGAKATFSSQGKILKGEVVFVNPEINPLNATVEVWIEFANPKLSVRPGAKGAVQIFEAPQSTAKLSDQKMSK